MGGFLAPRSVVLVVEDEEPIIRVLQRSAQHFGLQLVAATTANEALTLFQRHRDDIVAILMDGNLAEGNTLELTRTLSAQYQGPVIATTGNPYMEERLRNAGCNYACYKPEDPVLFIIKLLAQCDTDPGV